MLIALSVFYSIPGYNIIFYRRVNLKTTDKFQLGAALFLISHFDN